MKIGLFGGSFDPVHIGHRKLVEEVNKQLQFDLIYIIPTRTNPWKATSYFTSNQRKEMLEIAFSHMGNVLINTIELDSTDEINYTITTLENIKQKHKNDSLYYMVGMDQVEKFDKWYKADEISKLVSLVCVKRVGYQPNKNIDKYNFIMIDTIENNYSSTRVHNLHIGDLDLKVLHYLCQNGLFLDKIVSSVLSKKRFLHSQSVANLARDIALANGLDSHAAYIAGMFHDIAKEESKEDTLNLMNAHFKEHLDSSPAVYHQWTSAYRTMHTYGIHNKSVLQAIENHTTAHINMQPLDMCVYVADKYDPLRNYDSSKEIALAKTDIVAGFKQCLIDFYEYASSKNIEIDNEFFNVYDKFIKEKRNG